MGEKLSFAQLILDAFNLRFTSVTLQSHDMDLIREKIILVFVNILSLTSVY